MPKVSKSAIDNLLKIAEPSLRAQDAHQFMAGLKYGFDELYANLLQGSERDDSLQALEAALSGSFGSLRQKQVLELCSWPIFDKPALPHQKGHLPEFLWLYCLPFVVQFSLEGITERVQFSGDVFDVKALNNAVYQSGRLNPKSVLGGFPTLLTREDLQREGSTSLSTLFVKAELGLARAELNPRGVSLDAEVECARVTTFYAVGAARLPIGERALMTDETSWAPAALERVVLAGLTEQGFSVENVTSLPPCSMAETMLRCTSIGFFEMHRVLALAKHHYDLTSITLEHPSDGWAELHANLEGDPDAILVLPAFSFIEPRDELQACVRRCCESLKIPFTGAFSVAGPTSSMLQ